MPLMRTATMKSRQAAAALADAGAAAAGAPAGAPARDLMWRAALIHLTQPQTQPQTRSKFAKTWNEACVHKIRQQALSGDTPLLFYRYAAPIRLT